MLELKDLLSIGGLIKTYPDSKDPLLIEFVDKLRNHKWPSKKLWEHSQSIVYRFYESARWHSLKHDIVRSAYAEHKYDLLICLIRVTNSVYLADKYFVKLYDDGKANYARALYNSGLVDDGKRIATISVFCDKSFVEFKRWVADYPEYMPEYLPEHLLKVSIRKMDVERIRWFINQYPGINLYFDCNGVNCGQNFAFAHICRRGNLDLAKFLLEKYPNIDVHANNELAYRTAREHRKYNVSQWLIDEHHADPNIYLIIEQQKLREQVRNQARACIVM